MKKLIKGAAVLTAALMLLALPSCKGRTMENMTPTGDTVEVVPDTIPAGWTRDFIRLCLHPYRNNPCRGHCDTSLSPPWRC